MRRGPQRLPVCAFGLLLARVAGAALPDRGDTPARDLSSVTATRPAQAGIKLDGRLDEPAWAEAGVIPELTQQAPRPGEPTPYRTEVRVLTDGRNLYVGVVCADPEPERLAAHSMGRDASQTGDDSLVLVFDTFGDRRTGYLFGVNAAGARQDGLISGPESFSLDWDGLWDARALRTAEGWSVEFEIPAHTLRFGPGLRSWGFNVERFVARERITLRWSGATLDRSLYDLSRAGELRGVEDLEQGKGLTATPYGLTRGNRAPPEAGGDGHTVIQGDAGLDLGWTFTPRLTGVLTVNPDFGETEVDARQINLTRFPLFFREKRAFFLEGSNLFEFGLGLETDFIPFFSRRIGLFEGERVPILGGAKIIGRAGRWGIGILDAQTDDVAAAAGSNLAAARLTWDANEGLRLGMIATRGDPAGVSDNTLSGLDAIWHTSRFRADRNLDLGIWVARTSGEPAPGRRSGWGFKADYPNDLWDLSFRFDEFGDALDPKLGFLPRAGVRQYRPGLAFQPRPPAGRPAWYRQFFLELFPSLVEDLDGRTESWRVFTAPFNVVTESGEHLEANWAPQFERLVAPFEVAEGVVIPPGSYRFTRYRIEGQSSDSRPWRAGATVWFGDFFAGRLTQWEPFVSWTSPQGHLRLGLELEIDSAALPEGDFIQRLGSLSTTYAFTPDLSISSLSQYDSSSRLFGMNNRFRWTIHPGSDLFVVWNRNWIHPLDEGAFGLSAPADELIVKLRWAFTL